MEPILEGKPDPRTKAKHRTAYEAHSGTIALLFVVVTMGAAVGVAISRRAAFAAILLFAGVCVTMVILWLGDRASRRAIQDDGLVCPHCRYSLKGLGAVGVCPECGRGFSARP